MSVIINAVTTASLSLTDMPIAAFQAITYQFFIIQKIKLALRIYFKAFIFHFAAIKILLEDSHFLFSNFRVISLIFAKAKTFFACFVW